MRDTVYRGQVVHHRANTEADKLTLTFTPTSNIEFLSHIICMSLEWGRILGIQTNLFNSNKCVSEVLCWFIPLISISVLRSFPRLHLLTAMQILPAGYWFHLSHCINPPGTKQEVIAGHLDATHVPPTPHLLCLTLFLCFSWPLIFPRLFRNRKLSLSGYEKTWPSVRHHTQDSDAHTKTPTHTHTQTGNKSNCMLRVGLWKGGC